MKNNSLLKWSIITSLLAPGSVLAANWYTEPVASLRLGFDDNILLSSTNAQDDITAFLNADLRFGYRTEVTDVKFQFQLDSERYESLKDLNSDNQRLGMVIDHRTKRSKFGLDAAYERDSTSTTELTTTGQIQTNERRIRQAVTPSWQRQLTERLVLQANYNHTDISYDDPGTTLTDYLSDAATVGLGYSLSAKTSINGSVNWSRFNPDLVNTESDSYSLQLGMTHQASETLTTSASIGAIRTDSDFVIGSVPTTTSDDSWLLDLSIRQQWQVNTAFNAKLGISETPGGEGRILRTQSVEASVNHKLSERLVFLFKTGAYKNESAGGIINLSDSREYISVEPGLRWRASEWWTIDGAYRYRQQEYTETGSGKADSNAIFFTVRYVWPREKYTPWTEL